MTEKNKTNKNLNEEEEKIVNLLGEKPLRFDEILNKTSLPVNRISGILVNLELKRKIIKKPNQSFSLCS